ncbi:MAG: ankyrin repeat domain-containing protein [Synergistaceae bacterium]|nr:ankyrin repeat domain-containing protein [Synergistaceae bacterium]
MNYDRDDLESVLRYLAGEYGAEIFSGNGRIGGKENIMNLLPDFYSTASHKQEYHVIKIMANEGVMKALVALKQSGADKSECQRKVRLEVTKLTELFIPEDVAMKYVHMVAGVIGLRLPAPVKSTPTPPVVQQVRQPVQRFKSTRPAMDDEEFIALCGRGDAGAVEEALRNGANVNAKYRGDWTALMHTVALGRLDAAEVLLQYGADINAKNEYGRTALHEAAQYGREDAAEFLLRHGADVNAVDWTGRTALYDAERKGYSAIARLLRAYGARYTHAKQRC